MSQQEHIYLNAFMARDLADETNFNINEIFNEVKQQIHLAALNGMYETIYTPSNQVYDAQICKTLSQYLKEENFSTKILYPSRGEGTPTTISISWAEPNFKAG